MTWPGIEPETYPLKVGCSTTELPSPLLLPDFLFQGHQLLVDRLDATLDAIRNIR